jgi:kinetochore protein NDC80
MSLGPQRQVKQVQAELASLNISASSKLSMGRQSEDARLSLGIRRSSIGPKASALVSSSFNGKELRPIRDRNFQNQSISTLLTHLIQTGYDAPISAKLLTAPSSKDFQSIFKFLYGQLDPSYVLDKKFEDEVPVLMKGLKYPFANEISKSQLQAVGSMHTWPILLAMLVWMVELIQLCTDDSASQSDTSNNDIFLQYLFESYKRFLAGIDDNRDVLEKLEGSFDAQNQSVLSELQEWAAKLDKLEGTATEMNEEPPLARLQREAEVYASDREKFKTFIDHLDLRKQKFVDVITSLEQDMIAAGQEYHETELLKSGFETQVKAQPICPEDIDSMNSERESSIKSLDALSRLKEEAAKLFWEREVECQKRLDSLEKLMAEYNMLTERLGIVPKEASNAMGHDLELSLQPNSHRVVDKDLQDILVFLVFYEEYRASCL